MTKRATTNITILLIIVAFVIFILGGGLGVFYQMQKDSAQLQQGTKMSDLVKTLSAAVVPSATAYGQVDSVNGNNIVLSYAGSSLSLQIDRNIPILGLTASGTGSSPAVQGQASFSDIKPGSNLSVAFKISPDGKLICQTITILSTNINSK